MNPARLPIVGVAALTLAGCGGGGATLATFAGEWQGHTRSLTITRSGEGIESIYSGCCDFAIAIHFRLSRPHGTSRAATATAVVTAVRIGDKSAFGKGDSPPHVGESKVIRLRDGVITETLTGANYCSTSVKRWTCGA